MIRTPVLVAGGGQGGVPMTAAGDAGIGPRREFGASLVLVRPDQHIAWRGNEVSPAAAPGVLTSALTGFTRPG